MPTRTCATNGCAEPVQREGARCGTCRRYIRAAQQRRRTETDVDIQPLDPGDTERILALVENAVRLLNAEPPQTNQARSVLYNALGKAEPWRTLRNEILNWKP